MGVDRVDQVRCVAVGQDVARCRRGRDRVVDVGVGGRPRVRNRWTSSGKTWIFWFQRDGERILKIINLVRR